MSVKKTKFTLDGVQLDGEKKCRVEISHEIDGTKITVKPYKKNTAYWCRLSEIVNDVVLLHRKREG